MQLAHCLVFQPCDSAGGLIFILIILYRYLFHFSPESYPFMFLSLSDLDKLIAFVKLTICSLDSFPAELLAEQPNRVG